MRRYSEVVAGRELDWKYTEALIGERDDIALLRQHSAELGIDAVSAATGAQLAFIAAANDSEYGLNASVFSGSVRHGRAVANRIDAGSVNVNEGYRATFGSVDAPMGGMKNSGLGRRNGHEGLLRFVEGRTISEATGILTLPRTGKEWLALQPVMLLLLRVLKAIRRA